MVTEQHAPAGPVTDYTALLPADRSRKRIALIAAGAPHQNAVEATRTVARRDGAQIVLFDAAAVSWTTSPYPPGTDNWLPDLMGEGAMRRVGREDLLELARQLGNENLLRGIYLSPQMDASDLPELVQREGIDVVISLLKSDDRRLRHVHRARRHAQVLLAPEGEAPRLLPQVRPGDVLPMQDGIRWPYVLVVLATFIAAHLRNSR